MKGDSKYKDEAIEFSNNLTYNLNELRQSLINGTYEFSGYYTFKVYEPKERIINAPCFKDKIVQIAINNIMKGKYYKTFIYDSYACIDNKGTHACAVRTQKFLKQAYWKYENAFIIKMDIKKFFYTIDRDILKEILLKKVKCEKTYKLLEHIIDSADVIDKIGLPLGNTLSQICANIYMNELDQYIKRKLSIKFYTRYADDMCLICESKSEAKKVLKLCDIFINKELNLKLNKRKTKIFPIEQGVNYVGYKIYHTHMLLRNESKSKVKRRLKAYGKLYRENKITSNKLEQMLNSWKGHADYANSYNFYNKLVDKFEYLKLENNQFIVKDV